MEEIDFRKAQLDLDEQRDDALEYYMRRCSQLEREVEQLKEELNKEGRNV